ncbi:DUF4401 domain-containing protein [Rheinheimera sp.]|uniref:DUF4401 domain-containing protein n=1 Tax=Rheinheimera sp. TaxID=1869214 RepID=UPI002732EE76|nr:DUF4401 domain-containing protein [Rheinheimera sp.]MDP2716309.1 DUF4401 domain-containing protein [Rheinheimera sp.]
MKPNAELTTQLTAELATQLQQAGIVDQAAAAQLLNPASPWWLQIMQGIAAWIASIFIISAFVGPLLALTGSNVVYLVTGLLLLAGAIWLALRPQEFLQHMSVAVALAGQGLLVYSSYELFAHSIDVPRYACALISALLLLSPLNRLHQRASLSIALLCLLSLIDSAPAIAVISSVLAALAVVLWCSRPQWSGLAFAGRIKSLLEVATLAGFGLSLFGQCLLFIDSSHWLDNKLMLARALCSALGSVLLIATVFWLSRLATVPSRLALLTVTTLLCILLYPASGLLVSCALMLACFYGCSRRWCALALLSMLFAISQFYYSLELNLLHKSGLLALSGLLVLAAWLLLQRYQRRLA